LSPPSAESAGLKLPPLLPRSHGDCSSEVCRRGGSSGRLPGDPCMSALVLVEGFVRPSGAHVGAHQQKQRT